MALEHDTDTMHRHMAQAHGTGIGTLQGSKMLHESTSDSQKD